MLRPLYDYCPHRISPYAVIIMLAFGTPAAYAGEAAEIVTTPDERGMTPRPLPEGAPPLRMTTDYAHPALGFGTFTPSEPMDTRGVRVEPFTVRATVAAGIGYDDNVGLSETNKVSSLFYTVAPSVLIGLEGALHRYYAVYRGNYGAYSSNAQSDYADHEIGLAAANSWSTRLRTLLNYDYTRGHTPSGISSTSASSERWSYHSVRGNVAYGAPGAQGGLEGDVRYSSRRYSTATVARTAEFDRLDLTGTFYYRIAPKTRGLFSVGWSDVDHPLDSTLNNTEMRYQAGVVWEALATTTGTLRAGYTTKDFSSAGQPDFSGYNFEASVLWVPRPRSTVDVSARRFISESYELGSRFVINTVGGVTWTHVWPQGIHSTLSFAYGALEHQGLNRTDTYQNIRTRVSYPFTRRLRGGAEYRHDTRDSDLPSFDFRRNLILLTLEAVL